MDDEGNKVSQGIVLTIEGDGRLLRNTHVSSKIGIELDKKGKIRERGDK